MRKSPPTFASAQLLIKNYLPFMFYQDRWARYSAAAQKYNPGAVHHGITLPVSEGGHTLRFRNNDPKILHIDITMLATEIGIAADQVPVSHPDVLIFKHTRPFEGQRFGLVFLDGQVLRAHERRPHREISEPMRLSSAQLIFALQRIEGRGTLVMLLHKVDSWKSMHRIYQFQTLADVRLFKPARAHRERSTFYLLATNVRPGSEAARAVIEECKQDWFRATFGGAEKTGEQKRWDVEEVKKLLEEFGTEYVKLARPILSIQEEALWKKQGRRYGR